MDTDASGDVVGSLTIACMAPKSEIMLADQECGKDLKYRVMPVNDTGQGEPNAIVAVVL